MSWNTFGRGLRFTTWGESHGPALGAVVDGCPPGLAISEEFIQPFLDARKPGTSRFTTQRREDDLVRILSGVFADETGITKTTGTPTFIPGAELGGVDREVDAGCLDAAYQQLAHIVPADEAHQRVGGRALLDPVALETTDAHDDARQPLGMREVVGQRLAEAFADRIQIRRSQQSVG